MKMSQLNPDANVAIEDKKISTEDAVEFLAEETEEQETIELEKDSKKPKEAPSKEDEGDEETREKDDEDKSIEEQLEEELQEEKEVPEDLELVVPVRRKEILAAYPDLFKKFPYLEKAMYLEQQFSEVVATPDDAREAVEKAEVLNELEEQMLEGNTENLLSSVREHDKESFNRVVDNLLPSLYKVDQDAYFHTIDKLIESAEVLNEYIFGTKQFHQPQRLSSGQIQENEKEQELTQREQEFVERQYETAKDAVVTKIDNVIKSTIEKNIDPRDSMTSYVRKNATREVTEALESLIAKDKRFVEVYDKLWERAFNDNFSSESMDKIKAAWLSKAKTYLPGLIKNARNEALKGLGKRVQDDSDEKDRKGPLPVGKTRGSASSQNSGNKTGNAKDIPKGMTTLEFLMKD
jgi:hypothetical protein